MLDRLTEHRRTLHRIPELDFDLPKTRAYVEAALSTLPCEIMAAGRTGLCAYFDAGKPDTMAFRCDMDALPILEENDCAYASTHPGRMHACGHDGHTAILLGFAEELSRRAGALPRNVLLVFQAAEETSGGAQEIIDSGVFEKYRVSSIFGLHLWPGFEKGAVVCRKGAFMAMACVFRIDIFGKSIHAAAAKKGVDALSAGARFATELYAPERGIVPEDADGVLKICMFKSGTATNVISGHTVLQGTMRCFEDDVFRRMSEGLHTVAADVERAFGCRVEIGIVPVCLAVRNDPALFERFKDAIQNRAAGRPESEDDGAPFPFVEPDEPTMTSEDFSAYQQSIPGVYFHLGLGRSAPLHSGKFDFDEAVLPLGVKAFLRLLHNI
jgi:hippurate hydrolase